MTNTNPYDAPKAELVMPAMSAGLSMRKAFFIGFIAAGVFFFYFIYVNGISMWVIRALAPTFKLINASAGREYTRLLGRAISLLISVAGTFVFLLPIRITWGVTPASIFACAIAIAPVVLVALSGGFPQNLWVFLYIAQPIVGAALVCVQKKERTI